MSLLLTLKVSENCPSNQNETYVFDESGGSIGRNRDNDFVLHDPNHFLSRQHAIIAYQDGAYYLTDLSENGVFLNHAEQPVGKNNTVKLADHDILGLGEYELDVRIDYADVEAKSGQYGADVDSPGLDSGRSLWGDTGIPDDAPGILDGSAQPSGMQDYFNRQPDLSEKSPAFESAGGMNHSGAEKDFFKPPSMHGDDPSLDWDKTEFGSAVDKVPESPDWDNTDVVVPARSESRIPGEKESLADSEAGPYRQAFDEAMVKETFPGKQETADVQPVSAGSIPEQVSTDFKVNAQPSVTGTDALQAFFRGAGVDMKQLEPEAANALMEIQGHVYREIVQGMMEVLRARFELKNEFRMRQTQIHQKENNPLKFIAQVDDALEYLLLKRSPGFLTPTAAFREAFQDIKDHQMAMVVGMRAAFDALLKRFDPDQLERRFTRTDKIVNMVPLSRKASCWDHYQEWYKDIVAAADDDFQGLFGSEFTRAYEEQMKRLSLIRNKSDN